MALTCCCSYNITMSTRIYPVGGACNTVAGALCRCVSLNRSTSLQAQNVILVCDILSSPVPHITVGHVASVHMYM